MERISYKGYFIDKTENGYRICKDDNTNIHTHIKNLNPSYKLIDNVVNHKIPTRCGLYYLESHIRLTDNEDYKRKLQEYYDVKVIDYNKYVSYRIAKMKILYFHYVFFLKNHKIRYIYPY